MLNLDLKVRDCAPPIDPLCSTHPKVRALSCLSPSGSGVAPPKSYVSKLHRHKNSATPRCVATAQDLESNSDVFQEHTPDSDLDTLTEFQPEHSSGLKQFSGFGVSDGHCRAYELDTRGRPQQRLSSPLWEEYIDFLE